MNAVVPLNVAAVRVSENDSTNVVGAFKGRVANFDQIPYLSSDPRASTGDTVVWPLDADSAPLNPLGPGIHVHWELPDFFRRGVQQPGNGAIVFPQVPNRWLVTRRLSLYNTGTGQWDVQTPHSWIVESDFIAPDLIPDSDGTLRPAAPVPLPVNPPRGKKPFRYMGRVVDAANWNPAKANPADYLPSYNGPDGKPYYLTANGFLGPGFSAYYPDCCSVFGFWDRFLDQPSLASAIVSNQPVQFKVSYQIVGWIQPGATDALDSMAARVTSQYNAYVDQCDAQHTAVVETPATVFCAIAKKELRWEFTKADIVFQIDNTTKKIVSVDLPAKTLCSGTLQELVWNNLSSPGTNYFLKNPTPGQQPGVWTDTVELAVGNTPVEALSALLKQDMHNTTTDPDVLKNYEYLLDALQLGLLKDLEGQSNKIIELEEGLHSAGFAREQGGLLWIVQQQKGDAKKPHDADREVTLPLDLAEQLALLNSAQKAYDTGRDALDLMRRQLFMDWFRYVNMQAGGAVDPNVSLQTMINFLTQSGGSELTSVVAAGNQTGILQYTYEPGGSVNGVLTPAGTSSLAYQVWVAFTAFQAALAKFPDWQVLAVPAPPFWLPTDPVVLMEGNRIEPVRRNGADATIAVRLSTELLDTLSFLYAGSTCKVPASTVAGQPVAPAALPYRDDTVTLLGEGSLLIPMVAGAVADALKAQKNPNDPTADYGKFIAALNTAQGGMSPLSGGGNSGLYAAVRATGYEAAANPSQTVTSPIQLGVTFTNAAGNGWAPDAVGWNAQRQYPEFNQSRYDPFLPVSLIWSLQFDPLVHAAGADYSPGNIKSFFQLNADAIDYQYQMNGTTPVPFTTGLAVEYDSSVVLAKKPTFSLTRQIDSYVTNYPSDPANSTLEAISAYYQTRKIMAQGMSGFSVEQTLATFLAQIPVEDLTQGAQDSVTKQISTAAIANKLDSWYDSSFNGYAPLSAGLPALHNFGPLRAGFMEITGLEIVDVFGQRLQLQTAVANADGSLQVTAAMTMQPMPGDTVHAGMIYCPPRILHPSRLWFRWLSAAHNANVSGITADFVEMNTHPATSPVCGWVLPNHLDDNLFFYDANGAAIGSFGVEHDDVVYRTRAGNLNNPTDSLAVDIGPQGAPLPGVNPHTADFMWYLSKQTAGFLRDMMQAILNSDTFINSANFAQDASLAVFIGRPLAITRAVIGMETSGGLLPLSQASTAATDPWPQDVNNGRYQYANRMAYSSAKLGSVQFPVRLGDLANIDDGLVGFLIDGQEPTPYGTFYSPAAEAGWKNGVVPPASDTVQLTLNAAPITLTMLIDPRAAVHATVGVLPVEELGVPPDQYAETMRNLQMTFFTMPVLKERQGLELPLPKVAGYLWSWVSPGAVPEVPLTPDAVNDDAVWDYSPQVLLEGWLKLRPELQRPPAAKPRKSP